MIKHGEKPFATIRQQIKSVNEKKNKRKPITVTVNEGGVKIFQCERCNAEFPNINQLKKHMRIYKKSKCLKCKFPNCMKEFNTYKGLNLHLKKHPGYAHYKCKNCDKHFTSLSANRKHFWQTHLIRRKKGGEFTNSASINPDTNQVFDIEKPGKQSNLLSQVSLTESQDDTSISYSQLEATQYFDLNMNFQDISNFKWINYHHLFSDLGKVKLDYLLGSLFQES